MVNYVWQDNETGLLILTHEYYNQPYSLIGVAIPIFIKKQHHTADINKAIQNFEELLGYELQDKENIQILTAAQAEKYAPVSYIVELPTILLYNLRDVNARNFLKYNRTSDDIIFRGATIFKDSAKAQEVFKTLKERYEIDEKDLKLIKSVVSHTNQ